METVAGFEKWIGTMSSELGQQVTAVKRLPDAFAEGDIQLTRHDQVAHLRIIKSRIMQEVEPDQVRVIGITIMQAIFSWLNQRSEDSSIPYSLRLSISNLIGELEKWKL